MILNNSIFLYILLAIIVACYIIYRIADNRNKRIVATRRFFNRVNYVDLEIGLLEGENKVNDDNDNDTDKTQ